ncbi:hypothetical protein GCM10010399_63450 [Dactylosporangium fulvum]
MPLRLRGSHRAAGEPLAGREVALARRGPAFLFGRTGFELKFGPSRVNPDNRADLGVVVLDKSGQIRRFMAPQLQDRRVVGPPTLSQRITQQAPRQHKVPLDL